MPSKNMKKTQTKIEDVFKKIFKGKEIELETAKSVDDITATNRKNAAIISSILAAVDIEKSQLSDEIKTTGVAEYGECEEESFRQNLIEDFNEAATITDDMHDIDEYNLVFAKYYKEAAENGQNQTFHWAGTALSKGLSLRKNLSENDENIRLLEKDNRLEQMETFKNLLMACRAIDEASAKANAWSIKFNKDDEDFKEVNQQIIDELSTDEGAAADAELDDNPTQAKGPWTSRARYINDLWNKLVTQEIALIRTGIWMNESRETLVRHERELTAFKEKLSNNSGIYDKTLAVEFEKLMKHQTEVLQETQFYNNAILETLQRSTADIVIIATESDEVKNRAYVRETAKTRMEERELKEKKLQNSAPSHLAETLKQTNEIKQTNRQMNSME